MRVRFVCCVCFGFVRFLLNQHHPREESSTTPRQERKKAPHHPWRGGEAAPHLKEPKRRKGKPHQPKERRDAAFFGWCCSPLLLLGVAAFSLLLGACCFPYLFHVECCCFPPRSCGWRCCSPLSFWIALFSAPLGGVVPPLLFGWHRFPLERFYFWVHRKRTLWMCNIYKRRMGGGSTTLNKQERQGTTAPSQRRRTKTSHQPKGKREERKHHHPEERTQEEEGESCTTPKEAGTQHRPQGGNGEGESNISPQEGDGCVSPLICRRCSLFSPLSFRWHCCLPPSSLGAVLLWLVLQSHPLLVWCGASVSLLGGVAFSSHLLFKLR